MFGKLNARRLESLPSCRPAAASAVANDISNVTVNYKISTKPDEQVATGRRTINTALKVNSHAQLLLTWSAAGDNYLKDKHTQFFNFKVETLHTDGNRQSNGQQ